jgi:hypothetical protein
MENNFLREIKRFYWIFPLCGGIISIIGFFIPAWYSTTEWDENLWIWGLIEHILPSSSEFTLLPKELFIPSLITGILILFSSNMILVKTFYVARGKTIFGPTERIWIIMAILEICAAIFYIIAMQIGWHFYTQRINYGEQRFWIIYDFNIGIIFPFLGSVLIIIGVIMGKFINREINNRN